MLFEIGNFTLKITACMGEGDELYMLIVTGKGINALKKCVETSFTGTFVQRCLVHNDGNPEVHHISPR
jgi:hypothetical protein